MSGKLFPLGDAVEGNVPLGIAFEAGHVFGAEFRMLGGTAFYVLHWLVSCRFAIFVLNKSIDLNVPIGMWQPFLLGVGILVLCSAAGVGISFYFAKRREQRKAKIEDILSKFPGRWASDFLDPKFATRGFLKNSVSFGDMHVDCTPDGLLIHDNGAYHFLYKKEGSPLAKIANKSYPLEFIAAYNNYFWIQGDAGKFQLRGALYKGTDFLPIAEEWGWDIYNGVPEGAEVPKKYKAAK